MGISSIDSLTQLSWGFYIDKDCQVPLGDNITMDIPDNNIMSFYYACVADTINNDGTITRYDVDFQKFFPILKLVQVEEQVNDMYILSESADGNNANGSIEEVVVWKNPEDEATVKDFQLSRKSAIDSVTNDYYASVEIAKSANVTHVFDFIEGETFAVDSIDGNSTIVVNADKVTLQGLNKPALSVDDLDENILIEDVRLERSFAVNVKFSIRVGRSFTILDVADSINLKYDYSNRNFVLTITEYFKEEVFQFSSVAIDHLYGETNDVAIVKSKHKIKVLVNGEVVVDEDWTGEINKIDIFTLPTEYVEHSGIESVVYLTTELKTYHLFDAFLFNRQIALFEDDWVPHRPWLVASPEVENENESSLINTPSSSQGYRRSGDEYIYSTIGFGYNSRDCRLTEVSVKKLEHDKIYKVNIKFKKELPASSDGIKFAMISYVDKEEILDIKEVKTKLEDI